MPNFLLYYMFFSLIYCGNIVANESNPLPLNIYAVHIIPEQPKPDKFANQEGCYLPSYDRVLEVGVPFAPQNHKDGSSCVRYTCKKDSGVINVEKCSFRVQTDNCKLLAGDLSQAYPECCQKSRCRFPNGTVIDFY